MEKKQKILEMILQNPQTLHTLNASLDMPNDEIESILTELKQERFIEIHKHKLNNKNKTGYMQFLLLSECDSKDNNEIRKSNNKKKPTTLKPKIKSKSHSQRRRKFKPPKFLKNKTNDCPKTTGMLNKKSKPKILGKKRKLDEISDEEKETNDNIEPNRKRAKYNHNNNNNKEMESLKYREVFLIAEINKLKSTNNTNTLNKKDKQCLDYDELVSLTEKWTVATQQIIEAIIDGKNDPDATVPKLLQYFQIDPKQVRWNVGDEEFE